MENEPEARRNPIEGTEYDAAFAIKMKQNALDAIIPETLEEFNQRLPLITELTGRPHNIDAIYEVVVESEIMNAIIGNREIDFAKIEPGEWHMKHAPSIKGKRADQAVRIAQIDRPISPRQGWFVRLFGR